MALAGATVITANTRAARYLRLETERAGLRAKPVGETADILPLPAWITRTWTEGLLAGVMTEALLSAEVVSALWQKIVEGSAAGRELMNHRAAAALAESAWQLLHHYRLPRTRSLYGGTAESKAFYGWAESFEARCRHEGWVEETAAVETVIARAARIPKLPQRMVVFGFDQLTPLQNELWNALRSAGTEVTVLAPEDTVEREHARAVGFADSAAELRAAARWSRKKLADNPEARIGIIVPGLAQMRGQVEATFSTCLHPEHAVLPRAGQTRSFEISLGIAVGEHPMTRSALRLLRLGTSGLPAAEFSRLVRTRYLGNGTSDATGRALADVELRKSLRETVTLPGLLQLNLEKARTLAPQWFLRLDELDRWRRKLSSKMTRSDWAAEARRWLVAAGWPGDGEGEFALSSEEFQLTNAWDALLSEFGALDLVLPERSPTDLQRELEHAAGEQTFAAQNEAAPIQVVGPSAASGESFDALWFCGLTDEGWPERIRPNPLIPYALQKSAGTPHASAEANFALAQRVTMRLLQSADECILSWPGRDEERELRASPFLRDFAPTSENALAGALVRGWVELQKDAELEEKVDERAPATKGVTYGTKLLEWQSGCPFRAFAQGRLGASPLDEPTLGTSPRDRGKITELALEFVWKQFRDLQNLELLTEAQIDQEIDQAIELALAKAFPHGEEQWMRRHRELERERLEQLMHEWLAVERKREPFRDVQHQQEIELQLGELTIHGRADRIERTNDGALVILDYKTGGTNYSPTRWEGERPDDPQLPIYAIAQRAKGQEVAAVAFARVRLGKCDFAGEAERKEILGKAKGHGKYGRFQETLAGWRPQLERLAGEFLSGHAEVDPKRPPSVSNSTCTYCHLSALCRIAEFAAPGEGLEEAAHDE